MAALASKIRVIDLLTNTEVTAGFSVPVFELTWEMSKVGTMAYTTLFDSFVPQELIVASGGYNGLGTPRPYLVSLSLDGGVTYDYHMMLSKPLHNNVFSDSGPSLFQGYAVNGVDRVTFHGVPFRQVMYGAAGTIKANGTAGPNSFLSSVFLPNQKGIFRTIPGNSEWVGHDRLGYIPKVSPFLADILVDTDSEADYLIKVFESILTQVTGTLIPGDPLPIGSRGQWVEDCSDAALNLTGSSPSLSIGTAGTSTYLSFSTDADPAVDTEAQILEQADARTYMDVQADMGSLLSKISYVGGQTNHGLPQGASITSPTIIYPSASASSTRWNDNLCVFVAADSTGFGGVYYWPHDGMGYMLGGSLLNPKNLQYYKPTNTLYVATDLGVYARTGDVLANAEWSQVGGLSYKCKGLVVDADTGQIVVEVSGSGNADGLYGFPGVSGDTSGTPSGYSGWSCLTTGSFSAWTYTGSGNELIIADSNAPAVVTQIIGATNPSSSTSRYLPTPNLSPITSLSPMVFTYEQTLDGLTQTLTETGTCVCTAAGAFGLYFLTPGGDYTDLNPDNTLVDAVGMPIAVNKVQNFSGTMLIGNRTIRPTLFALTDSGVYFTVNQTGGGWQSLGQQSGIADQNITGLAVGSPQTLVTHKVSRLYATTSSALYCSHTGGVFWDDEIAQGITIGQYLTELGRLVGQVPFLANDVTSLGTLDGGPFSTNTPGINIPHLPKAFALNNGLVWVRPLNEHNQWEYRLVHTTSAAPYNPIEFGEISDLVTDSATNHAVASGVLAKAEVRYMGDRCRLQNLVTVRSSFAQTTHKLRTLRPSHKVSLTYQPGGPWLTDFDHTPMYVIRHKIYKQDQPASVTAFTETVLSTVLRTTPITMQEVADGIRYVQGRMQRKAGKVVKIGGR